MRKKNSKTHVFPYEALEPFIEVSPTGKLTVKPYARGLKPDLLDDVEKLNSDPQNKELFEKISGEISDLKRGIDDLVKRVSEIGDPEKIRAVLTEMNLMSEIRNAVSGGVSSLGKDLGDELKAEISKVIVEARTERKSLEEKIEKLELGISNITKLMSDMNIKDEVKNAVESVIRDELKTYVAQPLPGDVVALLGGLKVSGDEILRRLSPEVVSGVIAPFVESLRTQITSIRLGEDVERSIRELRDLIQTSGGLIKQQVSESLMEMEPSNPQLTDFIKEISSLEGILKNMKPTFESIEQAVRLMGDENAKLRQSMERFLNERSDISLELMIKQLRTIIPGFREEITTMLENMRRTIVEYDQNTGKRFDEVMLKIGELKLNDGIKDSIDSIIKEDEVTRSELSSATGKIIKILEDVVVKDDVSLLKKINEEVGYLRTSVESIDVNKGIPKFQEDLLAGLNKLFQASDAKLRSEIQGINLDSVRDAVNRHSTSETERVIFGMNAQKQDFSKYFETIEGLISGVREAMDNAPNPVPQTVDLSGIEARLAELAQMISTNQTERQRVSAMIDELSGLKGDMNRMFSSTYDNLVKYHEGQTDIIMTKLSQITDVVPKAEQISEIISRFNGLEQYLRSLSQGSPEKKMDEVDEAVDKCEGLQEILKRLDVDDVQEAKLKIESLLKKSESPEPKQPVSYASPPDIKSLLTFDEAETNEYRGKEVDKFVQLGIQVFELRNRFTKLVHSSVFLRDKMLILANKPRFDGDVMEQTPLEEVAEGEEEMFLIKDAFSQIIPPTQEALDMATASILQRVTPLEKLLDLVVKGKESVKEELKPILMKRGSEIRNGYYIYGLDEIFDVVFLLINNAREFVRSAPTKESLLNGTPSRYALVNAFVGTLVESIRNVETLRDIHGTTDSQIRLPSHVMSYVKVRIDKGDLDTRYSINLDDNNEKILLAHEPYVTGSLSVGKVINPYRYDVYGPHTRVFTSKMSNEDMSNNMKEIVSEIDAGKNLVLITLGPSGSGKTSTILYSRNEGKAGVLPRVLSQISSAKYSKGILVGYELAASYADDGKMYWKHHAVFSGDVKMSRDANNEWKVSDNLETSVMDYSISGICEESDPYSKVNRKPIKVKSGKMLGDLMADIVDMRLNCGTKNNPFSSRTHLFIFFKIDNGPTIIVGDLAGRENTFDCTNYETLLNIVSNKLYYPSLYQGVSDVDGILAETSIPLKTSGDSMPEANIENVKTARSMAVWLNLGGDFKYPLGTNGYFVVASGKNPNEKILKMSFYENFSKLLSYFGDFSVDMNMRIENLENELPPIKKRLSFLLNISSREILNISARMMKFFMEVFKSEIANFNIMSFQKRFIINSKIKKLLDSDFFSAFKIIPRMVEYLLTVKTIEERVMGGRSAETCQVRNREGVFINRSLDEIVEFSRMLLLANMDQGPPVHEACLPISCGFAGMDCLIPKKYLGSDTKSALMELFDKTNLKLEPEKTSLCLMTVLNFTSPAVHKVSYIYRPIEDILERIRAAYLERERLRDTYYGEIPSFNYTIFEDKMKLISRAMEREEAARVEYQTRKEYRGTTEGLKLRKEDIQRLYDQSFSSWVDIRSLGEEVVTMLSEMYFSDVRLDKYMETTLATAVKTYHSLNSETIPGTLRVCEYIMKAADHLSCSSSDYKDVVRDNDTWKLKFSKM